MPDKIACAYAVLRKYLTLIFIVGSATSLALSPTNLAVYALAPWLLLAFSVLMAAHWKTRATTRQFGGRLVGFSNIPTPIDSVLELLAKDGVYPADIDIIILMSTDLKGSIDYLFGADTVGSSFGQMLRKYPHIKATIYGRLTSTFAFNSVPVTLKQIPNRRTDHTNLFIAKDRRAYV
jgi:hypothetical protein